MRKTEIQTIPTQMHYTNWIAIGLPNVGSDGVRSSGPPAHSHTPPASTSPPVPAPLNEQTAAHGVDTTTIKNEQLIVAAWPFHTPLNNK